MSTVGEEAVRPALCSHCQLPLHHPGEQREVAGERLTFCCYGCGLAYQFVHGAPEEPAAASHLIRLGIGGFLAMNIMLFSLLLYLDGGGDSWVAATIPWLLWALATPLLAVLGAPFFHGAWRAARQRRLATDSLVSLATLSAYGYSAWQVAAGSGRVYFDTVAMVLLLFTLGRYLEAEARSRALRSLAPMLAAERAVVRVLEDGQAVVRPLARVRAGNVVEVRPGERIAVDGVVLEGQSACDESAWSGQATPQPKGPGATVRAGSRNGQGLLRLRVSAAADSEWVRLGRDLRAALAQKPAQDAALDRLAARLIPAVLVLALASFGGWFWYGGIEPALLAGLAVLVVACPCALGLAAPLATALGLARAAERGVLLRSGAVLAELARLRAIAFDKTGTLTRLEPEANVTVLDVPLPLLWRRAGALAALSDHPAARAVASLARRAGVEPAPARTVQAVAGAGLRGEVDGAPCALGSAAFLAGLGWAIPAGLRPRAGAAAGATVFVGWAGRAVARLDLTEAPQPEAKAMIASLHRQGVETLLLSGDAAPAVARLAQRLGIPAWRAGLLPADKLTLLHSWGAGRAVAMVGDGLNDGPVLAAATVGIAVGGASDLARESADVVLPAEGLSALPWLLELARQVRRTVRANLRWAVGYNLIALGLAAAGLLQPVLAAALMAGSSLLVVLRTLRAGRVLAERTPRPH